MSIKRGAWQLVRKGRKLFTKYIDKTEHRLWRNLEEENQHKCLRAAARMGGMHEDDGMWDSGAVAEVHRTHMVERGCGGGSEAKGEGAWMESEKHVSIFFHKKALIYFNLEQHRKNT
jgi:hypothetical protein